ncbi:MAG TPA: tRNA adenosine(34) deaminase TadA [Syntrophomonadaceae bacterium]|nr:tRNA adenosine(34) deaminase TadA [Syntrophomonas sp.]HRX22193.1 tRNA adenosine(34) deaminase TadA [Syntrophomonadaceae bacterium]
MSRDELYMQLALLLARQAASKGEIPIGAVVVQDDEVIAWAHNEKEARQDATAHAEMLAMTRAAEYLGSWRLNQATLYCNLEPCSMCAGAMINTRLKRLVYASRDPKAGAAGSVIDLVRYPGLNHQVEVRGGILQGESSQLLKGFFNLLRN